MAITIQNQKRKIIFGTQELADINPNLSVHDIVRFHANTQPALTNAQIDGPEITKGELIYKVVPRVGNKG